MEMKQLSLNVIFNLWQTQIVGLLDDKEILLYLLMRRLATMLPPSTGFFCLTHTRGKTLLIKFMTSREKDRRNAISWSSSV